MNQILKKIKDEFASFVTEKKAKIKHKNHGNMEFLKLIPTSNNKKIAVEINFIYMLNEEGLDVLIEYEKRNADKEIIKKSYSFSSYLKKGSLEMIDKDMLGLIEESFKYEVLDSKLKSVIPLQTQADNFISVIKNSWNIIINYNEMI